MKHAVFVRMFTLKSIWLARASPLNLARKLAHRETGTRIGMGQSWAVFAIFLEGVNDISILDRKSKLLQLQNLAVRIQQI